MDQPIPITGVLLTAALRRLALVWSLVFTGCSIPVGAGGKHLTFGYSRTSERLRQEQTAVPGLDVRLGTGHDGINLGWSSLVVAEPIHARPATAAGSTPGRRWTYAPPLGLARYDDDGTRRVGWFFWQSRSLGADGCRFIAAKHVGVAVSLSGHSAGFQLGAGHQTWLLVPADSDGAWRLFYRSGLTGVTCLEEQTQTQPKSQ